MELKQFGIGVVIIKPGATYTEWNSISRANLIKVSGNTDYKILVKKHIKMLATTDSKGSQPIVIAKTIVKAVSSKNPKTRYATGYGAKLLLFMRSILSDRMFDRMMLSMMK